MKQKAKNITVTVASLSILCRQAAHVAQPVKSTGTSNGKIPKPEMSENERYSTRSMALAPTRPIAHSTPEKRTGVVQIRPPTTKHQTKLQAATIVESCWNCFMA